MEPATMLSNITSAFGEVIDWMGELLTALTSGGLSGLGVLFGIGVAIAVIGGALALIKSIIWGA